MKSVSNEILENSILHIKDLYKKGGPSEDDYDALYETYTLLAQEINSNNITKEDLKRIWNIFSDEFLENTLQGHSLNKPFGYAGDYEVIDMMYCQSEYPKYRKWDVFYNKGPAATAVRNRKAYFKNAITSRCSEGNSHRLLNVASGPARDLLELFQENSIDNLSVDCVEYDAKAIDYAKILCQKYLNFISFEKVNIFKFKTNKKYDLIWSAGLFDYFNDEDFVIILKKLLSCTTNKYEIIIGNFTPNNPSRNFMEIILDWHLYHRDEEHLIKLAIQAGCRKEQLFVGREEVGVNLFLHIKSK